MNLEEYITHKWNGMFQPESFKSYQSYVLVQECFKQNLLIPTNHMF